MKLILRYIDNLEAKEIDLTGVLNLEIEFGASRWSVGEGRDYSLDVRSIGRDPQILVEPLASNAVRLHTTD
jgi:hypothetical protein